MADADPPRPATGVVAAARPEPPAGPPVAPAERGLRLQRLRSLVRKEFTEIRRDRRTLALIVAVPVILLIIFGYAATFDVKDIPAELVGHPSPFVIAALRTGGAFAVRPGVTGGVAAAEADIRAGRVAVAVVIGATGRPAQVLVDGSNLLTAMTVERELTALQAQHAGATPVKVDVLYNPSLRSAIFMVPGLIGIIMSQVSVVMTALGVVRERERGTIEQLMITPLTKLELMVGKTVPYLIVALADLCFVLLIGWSLFGVPVRGDVVLLVGEAFLFITATLGLGLLISTVAQTQLQATQMSVFIQLPQMLLSGLIFPVASMPWGVRWLSYVLPLTYFAQVARDVMLKGLGIGALWSQTAALVVLAVAFVGLAAVRFRKSLD